MNLAELLQKVDTRWHAAFLHFIETGESTPEFDKYMDEDSSCQEAVDHAFKASAESFEHMVQALKLTESKEHSEPHTEDTAKRTMTAALQSVMELPPERREPVIRSAVNAVSTTDPKHTSELSELVRSVGIVSAAER